MPNPIFIRCWYGYSEAFGWEERGETSLNPKTPIKHKHKLEIEAFPMDKWVSFKKRMVLHLGTRTDLIQIFNDLVSELELHIPKKEPL